MARRASRRALGAALGLLCLFAASPVGAQQTCYGYDETGRLVVAVNQQGQTIIYDHDAVGNITDVRRNDATGAVAITFVTPTTAVGGQQIVLLGAGFSTEPAQDHATIGGVAASVTAANTCSLTVTVPPGALAGPGSIQVTTPSGSATYAGSFSLGVNLVVSPSSAEVVIGQTVGFFSLITGATDQRVTWSVNGLAGGDAAHGTITPAGLYTAPAAVPSTASVTIQAASVANPSVTGQATTLIVAAPNHDAHAAVSVMFGPLPPGGAQAAPVSVSIGPLPGNIVQAPPVSVANAAVISNVVPNSAASGAMMGVTLSGVNFTGASAVAFLVDGAPDAQITATNISVNPDGTQLTATVSVGATALVGPHVVVVQTVVGSSALVGIGSNGFTVTP